MYISSILLGLVGANGRSIFLKSTKERTPIQCMDDVLPAVEGLGDEQLGTVVQHYGTPKAR